MVLHCVADLQPAAVEKEADGKALWRGWAGGDEDVDEEAGFILDVWGKGRGGRVVEGGLLVFVDRLGAYWAEFGVVAGSVGDGVEAPVRGKGLRAAPSEKADRGLSVGDFSVAAVDGLTVFGGELDAFQGAFGGFEDVLASFGLGDTHFVVGCLASELSR